MVDFPAALFPSTLTSSPRYWLEERASSGTFPRGWLRSLSKPPPRAARSVNSRPVTQPVEGRPMRLQATRQPLSRLEPLDQVTQLAPGKMDKGVIPGQPHEFAAA